MSRLQLRKISKLFPGVKALQEVDMKIEAGEIHALCGENGAGKSTLMNILAGNLQPEDGDIVLNGNKVEFNIPKEAFASGIALVYQHLSLVDSLSVAENIFANHRFRNNWAMIPYDKLYAMTNELLQQLKITSINPKTLVSKLSAPEKQLVEIAKALSKKPSILILDEPTASLTDREIKALFSTLGRLKTEGVSIIYISHRLEEIFEIADKVTVLKDGKSQGMFSVRDLDKNRLIRLMVGRDIVNLKVESTARGEVLLEVKNLSSARFRDISFKLHEGEILGIAGLVGAGRTEIARAIFGADGVESGTIYLKGELLRPDHPSDAIENGIAYVPEDRKSLGLFPEMTIQDNIVVASLRQTMKGKLYNQSVANDVSQTYKDKLHIASRDVKSIVNTLSGGNQQKVVLAKWLLANPQVLIVDEPTHGVDVGAKFEIYEILKSLASQGKGILMISSELTELIGLCDRILVINKGKLAGEVKGTHATEENILQLASN